MRAFVCVVDESGGLADPKPAQRIVDPKVYPKFYALWDSCLACGSPRITAAHLYGKGQGGDDVLANLIPLCGSGSSGCHGAYDNGHSYLGDFGRLVTPVAVRSMIGAWLQSEAGEAARWYLTSKLGAEASRAWVERTFGEDRF